jgi:hypothetical protein
MLFNCCYFILFIVLILKSCAWQPLGGGWDTRQGTCFAGCLTRTKRAILTFSHEFDIKPRVTFVGKILLLHTLHLEPDELAHLLSVINKDPNKMTIARQIWERITIRSTSWTLSSIEVSAVHWLPRAAQARRFWITFPGRYKIHR